METSQSGDVSRFLECKKGMKTNSWNYIIIEWLYPQSPTSFQTSSLPLSGCKAKIASPKIKYEKKKELKEKLNQSFKMFLCLYFFLLRSTSIHPIISEELSFRLRIHPKNKSNPLSEKEHFSLFSPFPFWKVFSFLFLCVFEIFFASSVDGHSDRIQNKSMDCSVTVFFRCLEKHSSSKDLKLLFAVVHIGFNFMMRPIHNNNILNIEGSKAFYLVFIMSRFSATLSKERERKSKK